MSEQEEVNLFSRIRENIRETQRQLYERKAKLGEKVVVSDSQGRPKVIAATEAIRLLWPHSPKAVNDVQ